MQVLPATIIIPWKDRDDRKPLFEFVLNWARCRFDQVIVAADTSPAPFCKSKLVNLAVSDARNAVVGVLDADSMVSGNQLSDSVSYAEKSGKLVYPYQHCLRLDNEQTQLLLKQNPTSPTFECSNYVWRTKNRRLPVTPGGFILIHRDLYTQVGGMCEEFVEWGCEDNHFRDSCRKAFGHEVRFGGYLYHMFHKSNPIRPMMNQILYRAKFLRR